MTPENIWVIGIAQEPSTQEYYLVLCHNIHVLLVDSYELIDGSKRLDLVSMKQSIVPTIKTIPNTLRV